MSLFKAPKAPDPQQTANAQTSQNVNTAITQALLNQTDQNTPWGSLDYSQTGTASWEDPESGKTYQIPQFTLDQTLNPADQGLLDQERAFDKSANQIAIDQTGRVASALSEPVNLSNEAIESRLWDLGRSRLDPMFAQQREALDTRLANQGINLGAEGYKRAYDLQGQKENDAYNQLMLGGRAQSINEILTSRNQPLQEAMALMSGQQVSQPVFQNTPATGVAGTDIAGLITNNYNQQRGTYNAMLGGLAGLGGAVAGGWAGGF